MKTTEITFKVTVDENNLPININWATTDSGEKSECKSVMIFPTFGEIYSLAFFFLKLGKTITLLHFFVTPSFL